MNQLEQTKNYLDDFIIALSQNRKISVKYLLILLPVAISLGTISFIGKIFDSTLFLKLCQLFMFTGAGLLHLYLLNKKISFYRLRFFGEGIMYTLYMSVTICIALLFFYLFMDNSMAIMAVASSAAFAFPHICLQAWIIYKKIPPKQYPPWTAPANKKDINELLIPKAVTFRFLLPVKNSDEQEEVFFKTVPEEWKLGKAFYSVLKNNDDNGAFIEYSDESGTPYGWEFYSFLLNGLIKIRLEPEESLSENGITTNAGIHVRRVSVKNNMPVPSNN